MQADALLERQREALFSLVQMVPCRACEDPCLGDPCPPVVVVVVVLPSSRRRTATVVQRLIQRLSLPLPLPLARFASLFVTRFYLQVSAVDTSVMVVIQGK